MLLLSWMAGVRLRGGGLGVFVRCAGAFLAFTFEVCRGFVLPLIGLDKVRGCDGRRGLVGWGGAASRKVCPENGGVIFFACVGGCGFGILLAFDATGEVAQLVEQRTENSRVVGSIPTLATILFLCVFAVFGPGPRAFACGGVGVLLSYLAKDVLIRSAYA